MKLLAAILIFMLTAQPSPAGFCDMHADGGSMGHAGMSHDMGDDMGHGMNHDMDSDSTGHACCPQQGSDNPGDCSDMPQCGFGAPAIAAVAPSLVGDLGPGAVVRPLAANGDLPPSHTSHPYRPPKNIS